MKQRYSDRLPHSCATPKSFKVRLEILELRQLPDVDASAILGIRLPKIKQPSSKDRRYSENPVLSQRCMINIAH